MEKEEEDRIREAAIASTPSLQPTFKPKGVTQDQLSKFRELHKRRLQLKSKSKFKTKSKDEAKKKSHGSDLSSQNSGAQSLKVDNKETSLWNNDCEGFDSRNEDSNGGVSVLSSSKKQKLHWGYSSNPALLKKNAGLLIESLTPRRGGRGNPTCKCHHGWNCSEESMKFCPDVL